MIPPPFEYHRATSVADAIEALVSGGEDARPLAGGQSLVALLKLRLARPSLLVDLGGIAELHEVHLEGPVVSIGALVTHAAVGDQVSTPTGHASLADTAAQLGDLQVRAWGTLAGALAHADPAGDWLPVALAHEAQVQVAGPDGERTEPTDTLIQSAFTTSLREGEIIKAIIIPVRDAGEGSAYVKVRDPASGYARAGAAAVVRQGADGLGRARVALTGVASMPLRLPTVEAALTGGEPPGEAAAHVHEDLHSGPDDPYLRHLAEVVTRRSIERALLRAGTGTGRPWPAS
jgi:aerobic carbon-monoxide dehydrogenase medium subunit